MSDSDDNLKGFAGKGMENILIDLLDALSAVKELSEINCMAENEEQLIRHALDALVRNQDMERCSFFKLMADGRLVNVTGLSYEETMEDEELSVSPQQFKIGEGIIGLAAKTRALQHCHNSEMDERIVKPDEKHPPKPPGSIISVPVFAANLELIGVLNVSHPEPYFFTDWHVRLLEIYKNILGQLISNFRLFQQMDELINAKTAKLKQAYEDINVLKEHYKNLSLQDQLTGLFNRRYFYNQIETVMGSYVRYGQPMCVLILDIDHFKQVNDSYGHNCGDLILKDIAACLQREVRNCDILARFGGEEFVIIFTNTSCQNGLLFAERIRQKITELKWHKGLDTVSTTISIGMVCLSRDEYDGDNIPDIDRIIHYADIALYKAKEQGRNCVVRFSQKMLSTNNQ